MKLPEALIPIIANLKSTLDDCIDIECTMTGQERRDLADCENSLKRCISKFQNRFPYSPVDPNQNVLPL